MKRRIGIAAFILLLGMSAPPFVSAPALAQEADLGPLLDRLERLERDIRTINTRLANGGGGATDGGAGRALARQGVRISDVEGELRATTGAVESVGYKIDQLSQRLDKLVGDVDFRLNALENTARLGGQAAAGNGPAVNAASKPPGVQQVVPGQGAPPGSLGAISQSEFTSAQSSMAASGAGRQAALKPQSLPEPVAKKPGVLPEGSVKERYAFAFGLLRKADYERASEALTEFIEAHGDTALAGNARYWLGETQYVRARYLKAAEIFLEAYQKAPKGAKAPDSLLKLGMSLSALEKKREACSAYGKLKKEFKDLPTRISKPLAREWERSGCR
ncbi:MAG TPA: tol-pal system protein YbgF [Rhodospirillales bacterium]|nr:tol-pal system protein YbgF [Rhodospirillales bacterium]